MGFYQKIKCPLYGIQDEKEVDEMTQKMLTAMPIKVKCTPCQGHFYKTEQ